MQKFTWHIVKNSTPKLLFCLSWKCLRFPSKKSGKIQRILYQRILYQLIRSPLGGGGGPSKRKRMRTGERGSCQCEQLPEFLKYLFIQTLTKKKRIQKWIGIVVKSIKILGTVRKDYHWIKRESCKVS